MTEEEMRAICRQSCSLAPNKDSRPNGARNPPGTYEWPDRTEFLFCYYECKGSLERICKAAGQPYHGPELHAPYRQRP